jgi:hypothetical protein
MTILRELALEGFQEFLQSDHHFPELGHLVTKRGIVGAQGCILSQGGSSFGLEGRYDWVAEDRIELHPSNSDRSLINVQSMVHIHAFSF